MMTRGHSTAAETSAAAPVASSCLREKWFAMDSYCRRYYLTFIHPWTIDPVVLCRININGGKMSMRQLIIALIVLVALFSVTAQTQSRTEQAVSLARDHFRANARSYGLSNPD